MIFERKKYLDELIAGRGNGLVKIIKKTQKTPSKEIHKAEEIRKQYFDNKQK